MASTRICNPKYWKRIAARPHGVAPFSSSFSMMGISRYLPDFSKEVQSFFPIFLVENDGDIAHWMRFAKNRKHGAQPGNVVVISIAAYHHWQTGFNTFCNDNEA